MKMDENAERGLPGYSRNLSELRRDAGFTLPQLASASGVFLDDICEIERGLRHPNSTVLRKLLVALRYDPDDFDNGFRPRKGKNPKKEFHGGKRKDRDPDFGIDDPDFWHWWHREGKDDENGGEDIKDREEAKGWHRHWEDLGCPVPKTIYEIPNDLETD